MSSSYNIADAGYKIILLLILINAEIKINNHNISSRPILSGLLPILSRQSRGPLRYQLRDSAEFFFVIYYFFILIIINKFNKVAKEECILWKLDRETFTHIVKAAAMNRRTRFVTMGDIFNYKFHILINNINLFNLIYFIIIIFIYVLFIYL